jgi:glycosyltransferase involved in cell wall biosynthesis
MSRPLVSIITLTRRRVPLLSRAMLSVVAQDYGGPIEHIVIGDDCPELSANMERVRLINPRAVIQNVRLDVNPGYLPSRLAHLYNHGLGIASGKYVGYLDDDNTFTIKHVSSLVALLERGQFDLVHSFRRLFHADGHPFVEPLLPWGTTLEEATEIYYRFVEEGILIPGSNIMRDCMFGDRFPKFNVRGTVDTSEWLIPADLHVHFRVPSDFTSHQRQLGMSQDNLLLNTFAEAGLSVGTTGLPTLCYYLGGFSNSFVSGLTSAS